MELLERKQFLDELNIILNAVAAGNGRTVLITGEAGIGKTALIEQFVEEHEAARILLGACDALFTPRPLGPLYDIARQLHGNLASLLEKEADRLQVFSAFLTELQDSAPTIVIFEDIHWADEATLDLIKFIGRRISTTDAMLIFSYRDDEVGRSHPLRIVLGDLPSTTVTRIVLPRLSEVAVAELTREKQKSGKSIYAVTGGNPFFVTEVLASEEQGVPTTVADAVLTRAARLSQSARKLLELVSCIPGKSERWLLQAILTNTSGALDECIDMGMLRAEESNVFFRHELGRLAIEDSLPAGESQTLHAKILRELQENVEESVEVARLVHHAVSAGDKNAVLRLAPVAAKQAASLQAHQEAASHYATALRYADALPPEDRARLLEGRSYECYLTAQLEDALQARERALAIWQQLERPLKEGDSLLWFSRLSLSLGRRTKAEDYAAKALDILEPLPPCPEKAMAYSNLADLYSDVDETGEAVRWGGQAIAMAKSLGDQGLLIHASITVGYAWFAAGDIKKGESKLKHSLQLALENGLDEQAARAYSILSFMSLRSLKFDQAWRYQKMGIAYSTEHDLDVRGLYMKGCRAHFHLEQGNFQEAAEITQSVLKRQRLSPTYTLPALTVLGWVRVRRGDPDAMPVLDEARELALATQELHHISRVSAARAEAAWLNGNLESCKKEVQPAYELALQRADPWVLGLVALWMWRAGSLSQPPEKAAQPYIDQIAGDWRSAAAQWGKIGCQYEKALALADGDKDALLQALQIMRELGANPAAEIIELKLRAQGVRSIPRGPRRSTQENPAGLTAREMEVLPLLAAGLQNKQIADKLHISPKTVDHHISAILSKLDVRSRMKAVDAALNLGILSQ